MSLTLLLAALLLAAEPAPDPAADRARQEEVARLAPAKARQLVLTVGSDLPERAELFEQPLLRWSNPTVGSVYGEVFLWTVDARPAAIASIFRWYHPFEGATIEIVSLSPAAIVARDGGNVVWDCRSPGITCKALDGSAPSAASAARLAQMRGLVRRFSSQVMDRRGGEPVVRGLRLLNQPLHRYESLKQGVIDGAIFAFAEVTDPEVLVLVEAVKDRDATAWRYALARMNNHELEVRLDDEVVQSWQHIDKPWTDRKSSYTLFSFDPDAALVPKPVP